MGELTGAKLRRGAGGRFTLRVPGFAGLDTSCAGSIDPRYAAYASGADTTDGTLRPFGAWEQSKDPLSAPIGTAAVLHRRHYTADEERDVLIAASGGQLFWGLPDEAAWHLVPLPPELNADSYQSDRWSCVTYEINPEGSGAPVDVLLMSSAEDGMICVRGDRMTASLVETPARFGVIARYAERVWGGGITGEPDTLYYSAPYDPLNWAQNDEIPEDGAGEVRQPSWDGDGFTALIPFAGQLIAFKRHGGGRARHGAGRSAAEGIRLRVDALGFAVGRARGGNAARGAGRGRQRMPPSAGGRGAGDADGAGRSARRGRAPVRRGRRKRLEQIRKGIRALCGIAGAAAGWFGGWDEVLRVLVAMMALDYVSGLLTAVLGRSEKTEHGGLSSKVGAEGVLRKALMLLAVLAAARLDAAMGLQSVCRNAVCWFYIANEGLSLLENLSLAGVPFPARLRELLGQKKREADSGASADETERKAKGE